MNFAANDFGVNKVFEFMNANQKYQSRNRHFKLNPNADDCDDGVRNEVADHGEKSSKKCDDD